MTIQFAHKTNPSAGHSLYKRKLQRSAPPFDKGGERVGNFVAHCQPLLSLFFILLSPLSKGEPHTLSNEVQIKGDSLL